LKLLRKTKWSGLLAPACRRPELGSASGFYKVAIGVFVGGVRSTLSARSIEFRSAMGLARSGASTFLPGRIYGIMTMANKNLQLRNAARSDRQRAPPVQIAKQSAPLTSPEAIRAMMETILHILPKDPGEKPAKKVKARVSP
jgi:hypothetical protein